MENISLEKAIELLTAHAKEISEVEEIPLIKVIGEECAEAFTTLGVGGLL